MTAPAFRSRSPLVASVALAVLLALPTIAVGPAAGSAGPLGVTQWAYGATRSIQLRGELPNASYSVNAYFGFHVILTETSTGASSFLLEAQRTMGETVYVTVCSPSCVAPVFQGNLTAHGWESVVAFANFSTSGAVVVNGGRVSALALQSTHEMAAANVSERANASVHTTTVSGTMSTYFTVHAAADTNTSFHPALGLVPLNLTAGESWTSDSNFTSSGRWSAGFLAVNTTLAGGSTHRSGNASGLSPASGRLFLMGRNLGTVALSDGNPTSLVLIDLTGPFHAREGFILLPGSSDLFGESHGEWESAQPGPQAASTSWVNFDPSARDHIGVLASATAFSGGGSTMVLAGSAVRAPFASLSPTASAGTTVQAQPESVPAAQQGSQCLIAGCSPGGSSTGTRLGGNLVGILLIAGAVSLVIALVVSVDRRRKIPTPPPRNASQYPPGAAAVPPPPANPPAPGRNAPPPAAPSDPLDGLW